MIRRLWSEQVRITFWAWIATLGAATMLAPLTESKRYLVIGAFGVAVVATAGALLRARRVHAIAVAAAELVVGFVWAIAMFARENAIVGFLPGPDAVSDLGDRWSRYVDLANTHAAPLPKNDDVTMAMTLVTVGLGIIVDVVAVSWRRASLLGIVFLAVYMTPVSILGGEVSLLVFVFGALGFVFLLAADERERLTHWGRQISAGRTGWERPGEVDEGGLRRNGTRVGLSAIALAAVLPILIPTLSPHYFGQSGSGGSGDSADGNVILQEDPILDLRRNLGAQSNEVMLRLTTTNDDPKYFRLAALDEFTGNAWRISYRDSKSALPTSETLPTAPGLGPATQRAVFDYRVRVTDEFSSTWLPVVYAPASINVRSEWLVDPVHFDVRSGDAGETTEGLEYSFRSEEIRATTVELNEPTRPPVTVEPFMELPSELPEIFERLAEEVTEGADTPYQQGKAIETWFRETGGFTYDIETVGEQEGIDDLVDFLQDRVGYCEQYASAMAIMARTLGIPSRVAVGFLEPEAVDDNTWEFRGTDMHAWPELYLTGVGWYRFEPTPNTVDSAGAEPPEVLNQPAPNTNDPTPLPTTTAPSRPNNPANQPSTDPTDAGGGGGSDGGFGRWWWAPLIPVGAGLILAFPRLLRASLRRRRWARADSPAATAEAAWAELRDQVIDLRLDWDRGLTPRAIGRSLRERLPGDRTADDPVVAGLNRLVLAIEQARYARSIHRPDGLRDAVQVVTEALRRGQTRRQRVLARWLPISLLRSRRGRTRARPERLGEVLVSVED